MTDNNSKDPWKSRSNGQGPPDLSEIISEIKRNIYRLFGQQSKQQKIGGDNGGNIFPVGSIIFLLFGWLIFDSVYFIDQQERGVVLRFGQHVETIQPGINIRFPRPIEQVIKINVGQIRSITHKASMLTQDENIVKVEVAVQWRISDPEKFLFNVQDPFSTLRQATESSVREVIGKSKLDYVITEGRNAVAVAQSNRIREILEQLYDAGIQILGVEMQPAQPPDEVKAAFDDAIKAREDEQRFVNEAEAYRNEILPKARGGAARMFEESNGYKASVIAKAEGESNRFEQLLYEYQVAPEVTRKRLYLDALESVFSKTAKVLIDSNQGNSLMYLPINELLKQNNNARSMFSSEQSKGTASKQDPNITSPKNNINLRDWGVR